jgi:transcriptional regulator with XRE-family HTH domain
MSRRTATKSSPVPLAAALRKKLGLPRRIFSRLTGFSERVIAKWEDGAAMSEPSLRRLREIERLRDRLAEVVDPKVIPQWLDTPNPAFGGLKPLEVVERGEVDQLWQMIFYLESGVAS